LLAFARRLELKAWPFVVCGALCAIATAGIVFGSGVVVVAATTLMGFTTAGMFTISYSCAVIVPVISGALWDLSGIPALAFLPIALCGILLIVLAPAI